ncbi:MAG: protein BatD [Candidatus Omnitrophica bacterium]|nr:protein BatD [Candidatus Omnitrophota bacterium]
MKAFRPFIRNTFAGLMIGGFMCWGAVFAAAEVSIETSIQPSRAAVGEPFRLTIVVTGAGAGVRPPKLPEFDTFRSYSQGHSEEVSFINGKTTSRSVFQYVLIPSEPGHQRIDGIEVEVGNRKYQTGVLEVDVEGASQAAASKVARPQATVVPPADRSLPPEYMTGQEIFVKAWVDREEVYINQPVYLTYTIYTRTSATFKGFDDEPVTTGFWVEEFPPQGLATRHEKNIGGYRYVIADVRTLALFPTQAGEYEIVPGTLKADVEVREGDPFQRFFSRDIFGRRVYQTRNVVTRVEPRLLQTETVPIHVKPFPAAGMPEGFKGAVGRYTLEASVDQTRVDAGQPVTLVVKLSGEGNLNIVEMPKIPDLTDFKIYDSASSLDLRKDRFVVEGQKVQETVLVPRRPGSFEVPSLSFVYFDPVREQYVTLKTRSVKIEVEGDPDAMPEAAPSPNTALPAAPAPASPSSVPLLAEDIRYLQITPDSSKGLGTPLFLTRRYWMFLASAMGLALFFILAGWIAGWLRNSSGGKRHRRSLAVARKRLQKARPHLRPGQEKQFYQALSKSVHGYFGDKLGLDAGAVSLGVIESRWQQKCSAEDLLRIRQLFAEMDYGRFAIANASFEEMKKSFENAADLMSDLERKRI